MSKKKAHLYSRQTEQITPKRNLKFLLKTSMERLIYILIIPFHALFLQQEGQNKWVLNKSNYNMTSK